MNKMAAAIACCGAAVALGLVLMSLGTQAVLENVAQGSGTIDDATPLIVSVVMDDNDETGKGVFAVQMLDDAEDSEISARVLDPFGSEIASARLTADDDSSSMERRFSVDAAGTYVLEIYNDAGPPGVLVFGAIGPVPDDWARGLAFVPFYVLLAGIIGMGGIAAYWTINMKNRRRGLGRSGNSSINDGGAS